MTKLDKMREKIEDVVKTTFERVGKIEKPTWFMETCNGEKSLGFTPYINQDQLVKIIESIKNMMEEQDVCRYIFVNECWLAYSPEMIGSFYDTVIKTPKPSSIEDVQGRREIVMLSGEDRDTKEEFLSVFTIDRTGTTPTLVKDTKVYSTEYSAFGNMFTTNRTLH